MSFRASKEGAPSIRSRRRLGVTFPLADQAMVSAANFLTMIMLARALGLAGFGVFSLAWLMVLFFASIQSALISLPMMSIGPKQDAADEPAYYGTLFFQQAVVASVSFLAVWMGVAATAAFAPQWEIADLALPLAFAAAAYQIQDFLRRYFFVLGHVRAALGIDFIRYGGQVVLIALLFATSGLGPAAGLWVMAAASAVSAAAGIFFVEPLALQRQAILDISRRHWRFARWLAADAVLQFSSGYVFIFATGALLGPAAVGALRSAQNLMGIVNIITMGLENVVPAMASRHYHTDGVRALLNYMKRVTLGGGAATLFVIAIIAAAPQFWLGLTFGESFHSVGNMMFWFAPIYILAYLGRPLIAALRAIERTVPILAGTVLASILSLSLAYPLVDRFGTTGALAGMLLVLAASVAVWTLGLVRGLRQISAVSPPRGADTPSARRAVSG